VGRTNPTYRDYLRRFRDRWTPFRRGLRRPAQEQFDALFAGAQRHADAAGYMNATDPEVAILLSMLLAHEAELQALRQRLPDEES